MASEAADDEQISRILEDIACQSGFEKPKFEVKIATKVGENYGGRVLRGIIRESGPKKKEPLSLIFKTAPLGKARREMCRSGRQFRNEGNMYEIILPALNSLLKEHGLSDNPSFPCTPRFVCSKLSEEVSENGPDIIVLEDMSTKGYVMVDRAQGLDVDKCRAVLRQLARLHATSLALRHLRPDEARQIESGVKEAFLAEDNPIIAQLTPMMQNSLKLVEDRYPPGSPEHNKLNALLDGLPDTMMELVKPDYSTVACVTHGDCWSNNILFKFDETGRVKNVCFLDFQIARVCSPVVDISYFMFTCTEKKTRDAHFSRLLHDYHGQVCSTMESLGCDPERTFSWSMFQDELKRYARYGLFAALLAVPIFMADSSEVPQDLDKAFEEGQTVSDLFDAATRFKRMNECKERVSDVLLDLINYGYL